MKYLKMFNESDTNQEHVTWEIEENAKLYLAYLIDAKFSVETCSTEYNDNGDVLETSVSIYLQPKYNIIQFNWKEIESDVITWLYSFKDKYDYVIYMYSFRNGNVHSYVDEKEYYLDELIEGKDIGNITGVKVEFNTKDEKLKEDINVPIKIGDTILGGRFKNRKTVVRKIGKNKKGDITVNDKPLLKYRIIKESISMLDIKSYLAYLIDDGYTVYKKNCLVNKYSIGISKLKNTEYSENINNLIILDNNKLDMEVVTFIELFKNEIDYISILVSIGKEYSRQKFTPDSIIKNGFKGVILKVVIISK